MPDTKQTDGFGFTGEGGRLVVYIGAELKEWLRQLAFERKVSVGTVVREVLEQAKREGTPIRSGGRKGGRKRMSSQSARAGAAEAAPSMSIEIRPARRSGTEG